MPRSRAPLHMHDAHKIVALAESAATCFGSSCLLQRQPASQPANLAPREDCRLFLQYTIADSSLTPVLACLAICQRKEHEKSAIAKSAPAVETGVISARERQDRCLWELWRLNADRAPCSRASLASEE